MGFIDVMRAQGYAVESVVAVLREQGVAIAARTYRAWRQPSRQVATRTLSDAIVTDTVRDIAWTTGPDGRRKMTPEGLPGGSLSAAVDSVGLGCRRRLNTEP